MGEGTMIGPALNGLEVQQRRVGKGKNPQTLREYIEYESKGMRTENIYIAVDKSVGVAWLGASKIFVGLNGQAQFYLSVCLMCLDAARKGGVTRP